MSTEVNENNQHCGPQHTLSRSANVTIMMSEEAKTGGKRPFSGLLISLISDFYTLNYSDASYYVIVHIR